ncbi:MAG: hypothetical protein JXM79_05060 [Sedimentisphaerales bacterium]|nr:hypothetical protein [Sedimentisphaerales bacterium]
MIQFNCEQCGRKISIQNEHAGKRGKCPECGAALVIPAKSSLFELHCQNCGQKINVPQTYAGKQVKCPTCKFIVAIPQTLESPAEPGVVRFTCPTCRNQIDEPESSRGKLIPCPHCSSFVAVPLPQSSATKAETSNEPEKEIDESEGQFERLQIGSIREFKQPPNVVTQRKLPWIFDIFLFPTSISGMSVLGIVVFTRFFFRACVLYLRQVAEVFMPCLAPYGLMVGINIIVRIVLYMYLCWYLCECIRGSANGGVRAVETKGHNAGLGDMFGHTIKIGFCFLLYLGPSVTYLIETENKDTIFWSLFALGLTFLPMSFLGVAIFETWGGVNPFLLIGSIFSTFLPYLAMTLTFIGAGIIYVQHLPDAETPHLRFFMTWFVGVYLAMVLAHLLGWFYNRYEEKLNWNV